MRKGEEEIRRRMFLGLKMNRMSKIGNLEFALTSILRNLGNL